MDDKHFDNLIRSIGSGLSRRKALRSALGGLAAAAGVTAAAAETKKSKAKAEGKNKKGTQGKAQGKKKSKNIRAEQLVDYGCNAQQIAICHNAAGGDTTQCVARPSVGNPGHCGHTSNPLDCVCPGQDTTGCALTTCAGGCVVGGACSSVAPTTTTTTVGPTTTTTTTVGPTTTTTVGPTTTTTKKPVVCTCQNKGCADHDGCDFHHFCGCHSYKEWCVVDDKHRHGICKTLPSDCVPNGQKGLCCSGYHRRSDNVCCDRNDRDAISIVVSNSTFSTIGAGTSPATVVTTVTTPVTPSGGGTTVITPGGTRRKRRRARRRRRRN